jgi:O-antigen/teichoic acid export membrane protein
MRDEKVVAWQDVGPSGAGATRRTAVLDLPQHGHQVMRIFGRNTLWLLLDRAGLKVGAMLAGLVLVGYLGPANLGIYSMALAIGCLINTLTDFGLTRYAARNVAACADEAPSVLALSLTTTLLASSVELAAIAIAHNTGHWYAACLCTGFIFTNIEGTSYVCTGILSAQLRSRSVLPGAILGTVGVVTTVALVLNFHWSVLGLLTCLSLKSLLVLLLRLWQLRSSWPRSWSYFLPATFIELIRKSWAYFSYSLTQLGYEKVAIIAFGLVATHEEVGLLSAALIIAGIFPSFTYAASDALLPVMTRLYEADRTADLLDLRRRLMNLLLVLCVPVGVVLAVFAPQICHLLGGKFVACAPVLRVVASRSLLSAMDNFLGQSGLTAIARVSERRNSQALGLALCTVLTIVMGLFWGVIGAAVATLLADTIIIVAYFRVFSRVGMAIDCPAAWSCAIAGCAMALACIAMPNSFWPARAAAGIIIYIAMLAVIERESLVETARTLKQSFVTS